MISEYALYLVAAHFWFSGATTVFLCRLNGPVCSTFSRCVLSGLLWPVIWTLLGALYVSRSKPKKTRD